MKENHFWNFIYSKLSQNKNVILVTVVSHEKGSPGKEGFKMAVAADGDTAGSIGGGIMEYDIVKKCLKNLREKIIVRKLEKLSHNKKASSKIKSGLICAGSQTNFSLSLSKKNTGTIKKISDSLRKNKAGKIIFSKKGISFEQNKNSISGINFRNAGKTRWRFEQATGGENVVYVIGSGHVGLEVCRILSMLDFYVIVIDSRNDLKTFKENVFADEKITCSYDSIGKLIQNESYVVIVTTGFDSDKEALKQVINKSVKYIGLMGTKAKIKKIFNEAVKDGIEKNLLSKVNAPIGIDINSDTPAEIAVSIAAEIIKVKNKSG